MVAMSCSEKAFPIVRAWFAERLATDTTTTSCDETLAYFAAVERNELPHSEEIARKHARSTLRHILDETCDQLLLEFLRTPVGGQRAPGELMPADEALVGVEEEVPNDALSEQIALLARAVLDPMSVLRADSEPRSIFERFSRSLALLRLGDVPQFLQERQALADHKEFNAAFEVCINTLGARSHRGFVELAFQDAEESADFDLRSVEVVAECKNVISGGNAAFLSPVGIWDGSGIHRCSASGYARIFPTNGDIYAPGSTPGVRVPERGELGVWRVEIYETDRPVRARIKRAVTSLAEVVRLPVPSTNHDSVRDALSTIHEAHSSGVVFELLDRLLVKPRRRIPDLIKERFSEPFDAWSELKGFAWKGRRYALCPPGQPEFLYDCAEPELFLKKLLSLEGRFERQPKLTKSQIKELVESVWEAHHGIDLVRLEGLRRSLDRYVATDELLAGVTAMLLEQPRVKKSLESAMKEAVEKAVALKKELADELRKLSTRKSQLESELREWESTQRKIPSQVTKAIRDAFERARADGVKALAETAVVQAIAGALGAPGSGSSQSSAGITTSDIVWSVDDGRSRQPPGLTLAQLLSKIGVSAGRVDAYAKAIEVAASAGVMVAFKGTAGATAAIEVARQVAAGEICIGRVTLGAIDSSACSMQLADSRANGRAIVLTNANLSDIEVYGSTLVEHVVDRLAFAREDKRPLLIVSLADGPSALPLEGTVASICVVISLDANEPLGGMSSGSELLEHIEVLEKKSTRRVWRPMVRALLGALERIDESDAQLAAPVILESIQAHHGLPGITG
jgi:hypothetical protein